MSKIIALDVGNKRIGVAISDELKMFAHPLYTIHRKGIERDLGEIAQIIEEHNVGVIVIGLPKNMDGSVGFQGEKTQAFAEKLKHKVTSDIIFLDERLTTKTAKDIMVLNSVKQGDKKNLVDTIAAVIILEHYLNGIRKG